MCLGVKLFVWTQDWGVSNFINRVKKIRWIDQTSIILYLMRTSLFGQSTFIDFIGKILSSRGFKCWSSIASCLNLFFIFTIWFYKAQNTICTVSSFCGHANTMSNDSEIEFCYKLKHGKKKRRISIMDLWVLQIWQ